MATSKKQKKDNKSTLVPSAHVSENGRSINIICQLPGILEEDIRIDLEKTQLTISAQIRTEKIMQKIAVPECSRISKKRFRDGILEIVLERPL